LVSFPVAEQAPSMETARSVRPYEERRTVLKELTLWLGRTDGLLSPIKSTSWT